MITGADLPLSSIHGVLHRRPSLLRSMGVFSFIVGGSGICGSGSDRCWSGSGWRNNRFHNPGANCQRWGALLCIDHIQVFANITHTPGILTLGDLNPDRSGGHVVPKWKSPNVMVDWEFGWKSPGIMVSVSSGENHPMSSLVWVFRFPVNALTLYKLIKHHQFIVIIFQFGGLGALFWWV